MGTVTLPVTARTTANANNFSDVKDNDQAIIDQVNGNLDNTNVKTTAAIAYSKLATLNTGQLVLGNAGTPTATTLTNATLGATGALTGVTDTALASPNNSVYKTVTDTGGFLLAAAAGTGTFFAEQTSTGVRGLGGSGIATSTNMLLGVFDFTSGDFTSGSLTTKFRMKMEVAVGATSPSTVTFTAGLYPVTISGGNWTLGTVAAGSTALSSGLTTNTISRFNSGDFPASALLTDPGVYALGVVVGSITVPAGIHVAMQLQTRNV